MDFAFGIITLFLKCKGKKTEFTVQVTITLPGAPPSNQGLTPSHHTRVVWVGFWPDPYGRLNVGDGRASSERVVALLIAHRTVCSDF